MNTSSCKKIPDRSATKSVIIIGAGWSGLACAVTLVHHGYQVCLLESARQAGGRARSVSFNAQFSNRPIDNGQHIMLGAYHYTRELLNIIGLNESDILDRQSLELPMYSTGNKTIHLKAPALPAPFHLLYALISLTGLTFHDRLKAIKFSLALALSNYKLNEDISVSALLKQYHQSSTLINALWEPLCLATMNTPIEYASAEVFLNVLKDSFNNKRQDSDLLFFKRDLSQIFCQPAIKFMQKNASEFLCAHKVQQIEIIKPNPPHTEHLFKVETQQQLFHGHQLVLATPAHISKKLLHEQSVLKPEGASLDYAYEPICTIYLQYPDSVKLPARMTGFFNTLSQWAIDRSINKQPGLIAVVISGPGRHIKLSNDELADIIHQELRLCIANLPKPLYYKIITEKKATFSCRVNIQNQRPDNQTRIPGLFLAGDYTDTHYPSTLEGAVKSGVLAARQIISKNQSKNKSK